MCACLAPRLTSKQLAEDMIPFAEGATPLPKEVLDAIDEIHMSAFNPGCEV